MGAGTAWFLGAGFLVSALGWGWQRIRARRRLERVGRVLDVLAEGHPGEAALSIARADPGLEELTGSLERVCAARGALLQRIEHEEFSLKTMLSSMEEGVVVVDARQKIRVANPAFVSGFGLTKDPIGRSILEALGEPEVHRLLLETLETNTVQQRHLEMAPGKGVRFVTLRAVPMNQIEGRPGVLAVFRDVTRLHALEQVRREFVANVSHELRTPLAIFHGYVENLLEFPDLPKPERVEIYSTLMRHSKRLNALVEDLLSLARLEARKEHFVWEVLAPGPFVAKTLQDWNVRAVDREVRTLLDVAPGLPEIRLDRRRIEQVLYNLLENALKHTPAAGAEIRVRVQPVEERWISFAVEDNGTGIAPRDLPHIFERFYRADKARTALGGWRNAAHSTGLGLSIVKHIVAAHGGEVGAESVQGRGARVWFKLPTEAPEAAPAAGQTGRTAIPAEARMAVAGAVLTE
jgi:two-component system phosphate regulon sensor histidine kinase PhoR